MRRLHVRVYLSLVGVLLFALLVTAVAAGVIFPKSAREFVEQRFIAEAHLVARALPPAGAERPALVSNLKRHAAELELRLALYSGERALLASSHTDPPPLRSHGQLPHHAQWLRAHHGAHGMQVPLPDGRVLVLWTAPQGLQLMPVRFLAVLAVLGLVLLGGSYPVARRITRRLESLQSGVERLGEGQLDARVPVEGKDEVAELARRFNASADRIERLIEAKRAMLASASHELRSPLARLRVALEIMADAEPQRRAELLESTTQDIEELDELIGDLLLASRLESMERPEHTEAVDLLMLVSEEAARVGAEVEGEAVEVHGEAGALRRLLRNLLENARRHGGGEAIEASLEPITGARPGARLRISDRGPGVPEPEREKIFEPFYRPAGHREGTDGGVGLGLALVRQIARHHGGDATCRAREGGGTEFVVELYSSQPAR